MKQTYIPLTAQVFAPTQGATDPMPALAAMIRALISLSIQALLPALNFS